MVIKTTFIPPELYATSPYNLVVDLGDSGLRLFRHPLYCTLYTPRAQEADLRKVGMPTPDEVVAAKLKQLERARAKKDINQYVFIHERPWRFEALLDAREWTETIPWFQCAGDVWIDAEGPGRNASAWRFTVFDTPHAAATMSVADQAFFEGLPNQVAVYRGANSKIHVRNGLAWTTDEERAKWFARRFSSRTPFLASGLVKKTSIASAFVHRGENEVILIKPPRPLKIQAL